MDTKTQDIIRGIEPLVNEDHVDIGVWALGSKAGIDIFNDQQVPIISNFRAMGGTILCNVRAGGILNLSLLDSDFDGFMVGDAKLRNDKCLNMNHAMMVRSMPEEDGFFYIQRTHKKFDYSITTWLDDRVHKRWDRVLHIIDILSWLGLNGQVFLSRSETLPLSLPTDLRVKFYPKLTFEHYQKEQSKSRIAIFPNTVDACPKALIENILTDKPVVISKDLLIGHSYIHKDIGIKIDFDDRHWGMNVLQFFEEVAESLEPREAWLKRYSFDNVSKLWAREINRLFGTSHRQVFYKYHLDRVRRVK